MNDHTFSRRFTRLRAQERKWPWIKAIGYSLRVTQHADGSETDETAVLHLSRYLSGKRFSEAVAVIGPFEVDALGIGDVNFREDDSRTRERHLATSELAKTLRSQPAEASFLQRQPTRQDDSVQSQQ